MLQKPSDCVGCPCFRNGYGFSRPEGSGTNRVLLVGEALGEKEEQDGLPFRPYAPAGQVLDKAIKFLGYARNNFVIWNILGCRPNEKNELAGAPYEFAAIERCRVHFKKVMDAYKPHVVVALGAIATRTLTGYSGEKQNLEMIQGFVLPMLEYPGVDVIGTYHPSYIQRGAWNVFPLLCRVIKRAVTLAKEKQGGRVNPQPIKNYIEEADLRQFKEFTEEAIAERLPTVVDFETAPNGLEDESNTTRQTITQVNVSNRLNHALALQYNPDMRESVNKLLADASVPKIGHNIWQFDAPVALWNGLEFKGRVDDSMWGFHHAYPDLGTGRDIKDDYEVGLLANLQYCASFYGASKPWKHLFGPHPGLYGCYDADENFLVWQGVERDLKAIGAWHGYETLVRRIQPILSAMSARGILINVPKLKVFIAELEVAQATIVEEIQHVVPQEVMPSKQPNGLKTSPHKKCKDCKGKGFVNSAPCHSCSGFGFVMTPGYVQKVFHLKKPERCSCTKLKKCDACAAGLQPNIDGSLIVCSQCGGKKKRYVVGNATCEHCAGTGYISGAVTRWCMPLPFNIGSSKQLIDYARFRKHELVTNRKTKAVTMNEEALLTLERKTKDPLYAKANEYSHLDTLRGTFGDPFIPTASDGRIHSQFGFVPATGQFNSIRPNSQNAPTVGKRGKLAYQFLDCQEASPNCVLIEFDWRSFHVRTLAWEARDADYARLSALDAHSFVAAHLLKLDGRHEALGWDDEKLKAWLASIKKEHKLVRDKKAKPAILGWGFGMEEWTLYHNNKDSFDGPSDAREVLDVLVGAFPKTARFRDAIPLVAEEKKRLVSVFGAVRWFWCIQQWRYNYKLKKVMLEHGDDWDKSIAFLPANDAFSHKKLCMTRLDDAVYLDKFRLINDKHDALVFDCPKEYAEECFEVVTREMQAPSTVMIYEGMGPFACEVEAKAGPSVARMRGVENVAQLMETV